MSDVNGYRKYLQDERLKTSRRLRRQRLQRKLEMLLLGAVIIFVLALLMAWRS